MKRGTALLTIGLSVIAVTAAFSPFAYAKKPATLCVGGGGKCFSTIQAALKKARSGDSIEIAAGTYTENVQIGKNSKKGEKISLMITGAGAGSTIIDGGGSGTVVSVFPQAVVSLSGVTIQNGSASGIVVIDGTLNLSNCVVTNNQVAGAMSAEGGGIDFEVSSPPPRITPQLNIDNCTISNNTASVTGSGSSAGGGIASGGATTIVNSTISGNSALGNVSGSGYGGGLANGGTTTIADSTISGNQATGMEPQGGGIGSTAETLILNNVTIADNTADFGIGKGGGLFALSETVTASNTIFAGNTAHEQADCGGILISQGHNLIEDNACTIIGDTTTNILGEDPLLDPLALNAPGTTETQALMTGSPTIGTGAPGANDSTGAGPDCLPTDQRGVDRPTGACDIGAYQTSM
jgi:hypothetical protein